MTFSLAILLFGSALAGWAVLRCVGDEHERRTTDLDARLSAELAAAEEAAVEVATTAAKFSLPPGAGPLPKIPTTPKPHK